MRQTVFWLQCDANQTFEQEGRIKINTNLTGVSTTYIFRPPPSNPSPRMLSDIVHDSKLIYRVHALFSWILRTANSAINEVFYDALPSEEQTTKQERKGSTKPFFLSIIVFRFQMHLKTKIRIRLFQNVELQRLLLDLLFKLM